MPLSVAAEHHIVNQIHVADQAHAESVLRHKGKAHAQLPDLERRFVAQVHDLILIEKNPAFVDLVPDLPCAHA